MHACYGNTLAAAWLIQLRASPIIKLFLQDEQ
jgi:hypothetical protein